MNKNFKRLTGILCFSIGITTFISMILPNIIWMGIVSIVFIGVGIVLAYST